VKIKTVNQCENHIHRQLSLRNFGASLKSVKESSNNSFVATFEVKRPYYEAKKAFMRVSQNGDITEIEKPKEFSNE